MASISNTTVVHEILKACGLRFTTPPLGARQSASDPDMTTLSFVDPDNVSWAMHIFSHQEAAYLRFYSFIATPVNVPPERALQLLNYINFSTLFESGLDLDSTQPTVRFKAAFRGVGKGLPVHETEEAIRAHIARSAYLHFVLKTAYGLPHYLTPEQAMREAGTQASQRQLAPASFI
jgi:hypothetical protein